MTTIIRLLLLSRPAAIGGLIIAVVVDAVDGMLARWSNAHIGKEVGEVFPSFANGYAASSVSFVRAICGYTTSAAHDFPDFVLRRFGFAVCTPILSSEFGSETSARTRVAVSQGTARKETFSSAIAAAKPTFSRIFAIGDDGQATKAFSYEIVKGSRHGG